MYFLEWMCYVLFRVLFFPVYAQLFYLRNSSIVVVYFTSFYAHKLQYHQKYSEQSVESFWTNKQNTANSVINIWLVDQEEKPNIFLQSIKSVSAQCNSSQNPFILLLWGETSTHSEPTNSWIWSDQWAFSFHHRDKLSFLKNANEVIVFFTGMFKRMGVSTWRKRSIKNAQFLFPNPEISLLR